MSSNFAQPKGYVILPNLKVMHKKRHFHLEIVLELIVVNLTFNPNIQTT